MKEKPIIFSGHMIRAILEGRKTQTRRIIKNPWADHAIRVYANSKMTEFDFVLPDQTGRIESCKYGQPGDRLWVRETWALTGSEADAKMTRYHHSEVILADNLIYRADCDGYDVASQSWRASIFMPRWASRIDLEITGIRVERLQDITEQDAMDEGCQWTDNGPRNWLKPGTPFEEAIKVNGWNEGFSHEGETEQDECLGSAKTSYGHVWESINGKGSWDLNPWVWVIEFKVL